MFTEFNETELTLFNRQTNFTFSEYCKSEDGTICAVDKSSGQVFIGKDLFRRNVHLLSSIKSVSINDDNTVCVAFSDSSPVLFKVEKGSDEPVVLELSKCVPIEDSVEDSIEETAPNTVEEEAYLFQNDPYLAEVYSRLINTGRKEAINYLVTKKGISVKAASAYVDSLEDPDASAEQVKESTLQQGDKNRDMSQEEILEVLKVLKHRDKIHIEYRPLLGKRREYDAYFERLDVDITDSRYFYLSVEGYDYTELMSEVATHFFGYMKIFFSCQGKRSFISCKLDRIKLLRRL